MGGLAATFKQNRLRIVTLAALFLIFLLAIQAMDTEDWAITVLRGLSVGMITFLVASGLSLIFGLMALQDKINAQSITTVPWYRKNDPTTDLIPVPVLGPDLVDLRQVSIIREKAQAADDAVSAD